MAFQEVICRYCGKKIPKTQAFKLKDRTYFCDESCSNKYLKEQESYKELIKYLFDLYNGNIPQYVFLQIKKYHDERKMKYTGIKLSLEYYMTIKNGMWSNDKGIGIVEYVYDEAKKYYKEQMKSKSNLKSFEMNTVNVVVNKNNDIPIKHRSRIDDL